MAFDYTFIGRVATTLNTDFVVQPDGSHLSEGARNIWTYQSLTDTVAAMRAPHYFEHEPFISQACAGDLIYAIGTDAVGNLLQILDVNSITKVLTVDTAFSFGNVAFEGVPVQEGEVPVFDDATGHFIRGGGILLGALLAPAARKEKNGKAVDPIFLKGLEGIEFRDLHAFISLTDGLDNFGILSLHMDELFAQRTVLIHDGQTLPTTVDAILELSTTKGGFLPPRLTTVQRDALTTPVNGLEIYNLTTGNKEIYSGGTWKAQVQGNVVTSVTGSYTIAVGGTSTAPIVSAPFLEQVLYFSNAPTTLVGQNIPFSGAGVRTYLNLDAFAFGTSFNPNEWVFGDDQGYGPVSITIPARLENKSYWEVEAQIVVDMGSLPDPTGNWGDLNIAYGAAFSGGSLVQNKFSDNFHAGSGDSSGSTLYTAYVKAHITQSGGDQLKLAFPMRNIGGPGDWKIWRSSISVRLVGTGT